MGWGGETMTVEVARGISIGKLLIRKKQITPRGEFLDWVEHNLSINKRQCQRYMRIARNEEKIKGKHSLSQCMDFLKGE